MRADYDEEFIVRKKKAAFSWSDICQLNADCLLSVPRPRSAIDVGDIVGVGDLKALDEEKVRAVRSALLVSDDKVHACGYLDTRNGLVLTSNQTMVLDRKKETQDK